MTTPATLTPAELTSALQAPQGPLLLDVRSSAEFESARLPGSVNIPLDQVKRQRADVTALAQSGTRADRGTVVVCQSGGRARDAASVLSQAGLPEVRVLDGGLARWLSEGRGVDEGRQVWPIERQVRLVAGSIVLTSVLVSTLRPRAKWVAAAIGAGLTGAALTDTCLMGSALARAPWNTRGSQPTLTLADAFAGKGTETEAGASPTM